MTHIAKSKRSFIFGVILFLLLAGGIFFYSQQSGIVTHNHTAKYIAILGKFLDISDKDVAWWATFIGRKFAHFVMYFSLYFVVFYLVHNLKSWKNLSVSQWHLSFLAAAMFAISDELHQVFIPGRQASILDIGIDLLGISIAMLVLKVFFFKKHTV